MTDLVSAIKSDNQKMAEESKLWEIVPSNNNVIDHEEEHLVGCASCQSKTIKGVRYQCLTC